MKCNLFSVDIWKFQFPDLEHIKTLCDSAWLGSLDLRLRAELSPNAWSTAQSGAMADHRMRLHERSELQSLVDFITSKAQEVWTALDYFSDQSPTIYESWINVIGPGGYGISHVHYNAVLSAVVYLDTGPGRGNIVFESPYDLAMCNQPISGKTDRLRREIEVATGDVVIFPGYIRHFVQPNHTDQDRISFAVNFDSRVPCK